MWRIFSILVSFLIALTAHAGELSERRAINEMVRAAFHADDFARLDAWADEWRDAETRTSSGTWKLPFFYSTLAARNYMLGDDPDLDALHAYEADIDRWIAANPASVAAPIVKAEAIMSRAWFKRGDGYTHTIPESRRRAFVDDMERAHAVLMSARGVSARDPHWHAALLNLYMYVGAYTDFVEAMHIALEQHPGYYEIHSAVMRHNLPQWGGTKPSLEIAAQRVASVAAHLNEADLAYARAYWSVSRDHHLGGNVFQGTAANWERIKAGFEQLNSLHPTTWNLTNYIWFACQAEDYELAHSLLERIGRELILQAWERPDQYYSCEERVVEWAASMSLGVEPLYVLAAFDKDSQGALAQAFDPVLHPNGDDAVAAAKTLVSAHEGVIVWRIIPQIAGHAAREPDVLFEAGETLGVEDVTGHGRQGGR